MERSHSVISEAEWTAKYKRALLETNPLLRVLRIEDAHDAMTARTLDVPVVSREHEALERALGILDTFRNAYVVPIH